MRPSAQPAAQSASAPMGRRRLEQSFCERVRIRPAVAVVHRASAQLLDDPAARRRCSHAFPTTKSTSKGAFVTVSNLVGRTKTASSASGTGSLTLVIGSRFRHDKAKSLIARLWQVADQTGHAGKSRKSVRLWSNRCPFKRPFKQLFKRLASKRRNASQQMR